MADCAAHIALAALTALGWIGFGEIVLAPVRSSGDAALDLLNRFGVGAVAFGLLTFAAGWLRLLYAEVYVPLLLVLAVVGVAASRRTLRGRKLPRVRIWPRWHIAVLGLLCGFVLLDVIVTCAPISSADALYYHAAVPQLYEEAHRIYEVPWAWHSYQPAAVEMLVLDGFLLWNSVQGAFAPLLLAVAALFAVSVGSARLLGRTCGLLAGAVLFAQALMVWLATSTFVEPGLILMLALGGWNAVQLARAGRAELLALAGVFAGAAASVKYPGAGTALFVSLAGALLLRRLLTPRRALWFVVPAVAVALPWYVKNWILTDNPVYPLVFGGANAEAERVIRQQFDDYDGAGRSPLDLLLLPFRLLADGEPFDRAEFLSPLFLLFAPLAFLERRVRRAAAALWAAGILVTIAWFLSVQDIRYLAGLSPFFAVLAAVGVVALARRGGVARILTVAVVSAALATGTGISLVYAAQFVPVVTGRESVDRFLREKTSYYDGTKWMNDNLPANAHVAVGHILNLYLERPYVVLTADVLQSTASPATTRAFARRWKLTHVAVLASNRETYDRQLRYLHARLIARVAVHTVVSRTRSELGPPDTLLVYTLPRE